MTEFLLIAGGATICFAIAVSVANIIYGFIHEYEANANEVRASETPPNQRPLREERVPLSQVPTAGGRADRPSKNRHPALPPGPAFDLRSDEVRARVDSWFKKARDKHEQVVDEPDGPDDVTR